MSRMRLMGKNVVVTGGAGLIGSFLVERLVERGAHVIVADDFSKGRRSHLAAVADRIAIRESDLEQPAAMAGALDGVEVVFHLASRAYGIGYSSQNHVALLQHNERITTNLLDALVRRPVERLVIASSSCVYSDDGPEIMTELPAFGGGEPERANWGYGWAKRFLEQKATLVARECGFPLTIVRPFNIYGEHYRWVGAGSQAIPMLVKKVMDGDDPVVVWGSGTQRRNYWHAADCADAMIGLVEAEFAGTVNIGTEDTVALLELVETICRLAGRRPRIVTDASRPEGRRIKSCDSTLLRKACPAFDRRIALEDGLQRMLRWYASEFNRAGVNQSAENQESGTTI
jgi:UDP-glucose 4-epimerase